MGGEGGAVVSGPENPTTVQECWDFFGASGFAAQGGLARESVQYQEMEKAFFAGAASALVIFLSAAKRGEMGLGFINKVQDECSAKLKEAVRAYHAFQKGGGS